MPLALKHFINDDAAWLIWQIEESEEWFLNYLDISEEALVDFRTIVSEKRRLEWLGGRMATKVLCEHFKIDFKGIGKEDTGKPLLMESDFEMALSHCYPYAVAYIHKTQAVGIDIDTPRQKMMSVAPRLFTDSELNWAEGDLEKACQLWCGKETLYKIYSKRGLVFKEDMELIFKPVGIVGIIKKDGFFAEYLIEFYSFKNHFICYNR